MSKTLKIRVTPPANELVGPTHLRCEIDDCQSVFKNYGNLQLHLRKHHRLQVNKIEENSQKLFFCPNVDCIYFDSPANEKSFKSLKFLKQHFQKVHAEKKFSCSTCNKSFGTESMCVSHKKNCGREYICDECGWKYDSSEALLTHGKRRGHVTKKKVIPEGKVAITKVPPVEKLKEIAPTSKDSQTQTEVKTPTIALPPKKRKIIEFFPDEVEEVNPFNASPFCNIETQTELKLISGLNDPMLYSDMHTQTCDEFLTELGLTDIQTQTNWPDMEEPNEKVSSNDRFTSTGAHDEFMVSTETQTSFTQCLLDSCNDNSLTGSITQHTQTCDTLLEGLFGGQENDLIGSFQSTHTQT